MKTKMVYLFVLILMAMQGLSADEKSNPKEIGAKMWEAMGAVNKIKEGLKGEDYYGLALNFMEMAGIFKSLEEMPSPEGNVSEWKRIHGEIITHALLAVGACGKEDKKAVQKEFNAILKLQKEGHKLFR